MSIEILVSPERLQQLISEGDCLVMDCRFDFSGPEKGREAWLAGHIPGAHYAHLDHDLASPVEDKSGRHPLPEPDAFAGFLASLGWKEGRLVVAYDDGSNALGGRLWWLMRYFGQPSALLDGGFAGWKKTGFRLETGPVESQSTSIAAFKGDDSMVASSGQVLENLESKANIILDAREQDRFAGKIEPLDQKAGHIPGAVNRHFQLNLAENGKFKNPELLRGEFESLLRESSAETIVSYCGSGVTACHNLFAMELAGMGAGRLYPGSWSEWIQDSSRPIEKGD